MTLLFVVVAIMIALDVCLHVVDLWRIRMGERLVLFKTWEGYNGFWITYWISALVVLIVAMATR